MYPMFLTLLCLFDEKEGDNISFHIQGTILDLVISQENTFILLQDEFWKKHQILGIEKILYLLENNEERTHVCIITTKEGFDFLQEFLLKNKEFCQEERPLCFDKEFFTYKLIFEGLNHYKNEEVIFFPVSSDAPQFIFIPN